MICGIISADMRFIIPQAVLLAALFGSFLLRAGPLLADTPNYIGVLGEVLLLAGVLLAVVAGLSLGSATRITPEPGSPTLVRRGVYRYARHPMYTSVILATIGMMMIQPRILVAVSGLALIAFYLFKTRHEERLLMERYPDYAAYRAST